MEFSLPRLLSPPPPKLPSFKLSSMEFTSKIPLPFVSFASMASPSKRKRPTSSPLTTTSSPSTTTATLDTNSSSSSAPLKKVLVPIGFGTEEMEAVIIVDVLRRAGADVTVASVESQLQVEAASGTKLVADTLISTCSNEIFDLVALPGGMPGAARLRDCEILRHITSKQAEDNRLYGAISAAPAVTLLPWGLLKKKRITGHPAFMDILPTFWAVKSNIQVSKGLTTSRGPGTSFVFAISLVDQLLGESTALKVGESLLMDNADSTNRKEEFNEVEWSVARDPRVLVPVANGSEGIEIVSIVDILRRAKMDVVVASVENSVQILASQGIRIVADKLIGDVVDSTYDIIVLPGGTAGVERLHKSKVLKKLLQEQDAAGRICGAVCSSPTILQREGLLKDKRATAHPLVVSKLTNAVHNAKVVIDGKVVTSKGLTTILDFALAIVSKVFGHARARSLAEGLVFDLPRS